MFSAHPDGILLTLGPQEADLLRTLINEYLVMLEASDTEDPVRERLFPAASLDDPEIAREYERMIGGGLEQEKRAAAQAAQDSLGEEDGVQTKLDAEISDTWARLLTDLRLAIGVRLEATEEDMVAEPDPADPDEYPMAVLHWLGALQETLVRALSPEDEADSGGRQEFRGNP